jgi:prepilin-type N-terminal cleavage/methylation domain-containing protein
VARQGFRRAASGFTLVELAVVMAIVALLLGGLMFTLSAQTDQRQFEESRRRLEQARELLIGFAITNGRLPCPAPSTGGDESPSGGGTCTSMSGWLPAKTIGYQHVNADGHAIDAWTNPIRYVVSTGTPVNTASPRVCRPVNSATAPVTPHFTSKTNLKANGVDCKPSDLIVCKSATGITSSACGGSSNQVMSAETVVAIVFSTGKNGATGGTGLDEAANLNGDAVFVYHAPTPTDAPNGEFDDLMIWISVGELYGRLITAGVLP